MNASIQLNGDVQCTVTKVNSYQWVPRERGEEREKFGTNGPHIEPQPSKPRELPN